MKKRIIFICASVLIVYFTAWSFNLTPFVIDLAEEKKELSSVATIKIGDALNPLGNFDFNKGEWEMYIKYSLGDLYSNNNLLKGRVFKCSEKSILKEIQQNMQFEYSGADIATADSKFYVFKDAKLMFVSHAVIDKNSCGIQSVNFGWISNQKLGSLFAKFEVVNTPFIMFR
jgi:hypothetical protein